MSVTLFLYRLFNKLILSKFETPEATENVIQSY